MENTHIDEKKQTNAFDSTPSIARGSGNMRRKDSRRTDLAHKRRQKNGGRVYREKTENVTGRLVRYYLHTGNHGTWIEA